MQTGYMDPVPTAFRNPFIFDEMPRHGLTCREMLLECGYAVYAGEHMQALRMIAQARQFAAGRKQFEVQINLYILEAYCYIREDQVEKGIQAFTAAYNMAHPIGILSSLIEGGQAMRTLIQTIRRTGNHGLDEAWLDTVAGKATTYAKRCNAILQQMNCQSRSKPVTFRLSSREKETLNLLSEGMSREEIGEQMGITIHGVKRHLTSLYEKLGATSRSDAVIRAEAMGLFQQKQPAYQDDMT